MSLVCLFVFLCAYEICTISTAMIAASLLTLHQKKKTSCISKICFTLIRCKTYIFRVINFHFEMTSSPNDHRLPAILIFVDFCSLIRSFAQLTLYVVRWHEHEYLIPSSFFLLSFRFVSSSFFGVF